MYSLRMTAFAIFLTFSFSLLGCSEETTEETKLKKAVADEVIGDVNLLPPEESPFKSEFFPEGVLHSIPLRDIMRGGPPKDGIPALTRPKTIRAVEAKYLKGSDIILGVSFNDQSRAYPIRIMNWHEVVNDLVGNTHLLLTYCPLCGSGIAFDPVVRGERKFFGVSGLLYESNLLMYDRGTKEPSLWSQAGGEAVVGPLTGAKLSLFPIVQTSWEDWTQKHPNTDVLSTDTNYSRNYNLDPYAGYDKDLGLFFPVAHKDPRLPVKEWVFGMMIDKATKAYPIEVVKSKKVVNDKLNGVNIVLIANEKTGAVQAYKRQDHTFAGSVDKLLDKENSEWDITDDFLISKNGEKLERLAGLYSFWFSWIATFKDSELFTG